MPLSIGFNMQEMQNEDTELGDSTSKAVPVVVLSNEWGKKKKKVHHVASVTSSTSILQMKV